MTKIILDNVNLQYRVRQNARVTLKEYLLKRMFRQERNPRHTVDALRDVSFDAHDGDRIGIIGHNGAGKSTLLKVLAGIYPPTSGERIVDGQISSLFDIALGFETEATGWENIAYRCYLQGETPATVKTKIQPIADFSELGEFLDMPVRCYSAGMTVRLAFAIATAIEPEILLVDEVLSAGDLAFQAKAVARMRGMMQRAKIIVMVSHDLQSILQSCDRVIWMDHGQIRAIGDPQQIVHAYYDLVHGAPAVAA